MHDIPSIKAQLELKTSSLLASSKYGPLISDAKSLLNLSSEADVKNRVEYLIAMFREKPREVSSELILLQEICLN